MQATMIDPSTALISGVVKAGSEVTVMFSIDVIVLLSLQVESIGISQKLDMPNLSHLQIKS